MIDKKVKKGIIQARSLTIIKNSRRCDVLVLDVGMGELPWHERLALSSMATLAHQVLENIYETTYFGIDNDPAFEDSQSHYFDEEQVPRKIIRIEADATSLPLNNAMFDIVILSDIFTIPEHDWCMCESDCECECRACECGGDDSEQEICCEGSCKGVSAEEKWQMLCEAIRVLKEKGKLVIACYQTHEEAVAILQRLKINCAILGLNQIQMLDQRWMSEAAQLRGSYELVFEKVSSGAEMTS